MWDYIRFKVAEAGLPNGTDYTALITEYFLWIFGAFIIISLVAVFFITVAWKLFEKLGYPGFIGIIPFVNLYCIYRSLRMRWLYLPTLFLMAAGVVIFAVSVPLLDDLSYLIFPIFPLALAIIFIDLRFSFGLARTFGKRFWFGMLILVFPVVMTTVLAFSKRFKMVGNKRKCKI